MWSRYYWFQPSILLEGKLQVSIADEWNNLIKLTVARSLCACYYYVLSSHFQGSSELHGVFKICEIFRTQSTIGKYISIICWVIVQHPVHYSTLRWLLKILSHYSHEWDNILIHVVHWRFRCFSSPDYILTTTTCKGKFGEEVLVTLRLPCKLCN